MTIKSYIEENKQRMIDELFDVLRIPSVSAQPEHAPDMQKMAEHIRKVLLKVGCDKAEVMSTSSNPVVVAEKIIDKNKPTVLVYGHYDVQPVEPLDLWKSPPFEPEIRDGKIYARGADDDKGQFMMHVNAFEYLVNSQSLACNVKFLIEGGEEIGSPGLKEFCSQHKELLKSDVILISDTSMINEEMPSITAGLRGLCYFEVEVTGANRDLHSGLYGGAVANPIITLSKMIARLIDEKGHITIPGFYDAVDVISPEERAAMAKAPFDIEQYKKSIGVQELVGEDGYTTLERTGIRPSLDVCGIWGGYTGEGSKTVLPSKAYAKISMRLVPHQRSKEINQLFEKYFMSIVPEGVTVKVTPLHGGEAYVSPVTSDAYQAASKAMIDVYGIEPVPYRSGGSIPIVSDFEETLGVKSILMGFGLETDAIHSPNENYPLTQFFRGIESITHFFKYFSEMKK
ncbi:MAG: dipeptidase [Bacteroidales bacterium]|jgi:acetylornithine deacetylase/succinyl-diaminopimelate desuccinylase-like protein|nr:dipeptidase [Bacteroidales bacterium]